MNVIQKEGKRFDADIIITRKERCICKKFFMLMNSLLRKIEVGSIISIVVDQMY